MRRFAQLYLKFALETLLPKRHSHLLISLCFHPSISFVHAVWADKQRPQHRARQISRVLRRPVEDGARNLQSAERAGGCSQPGALMEKENVEEREGFGMFKSNNFMNILQLFWGFQVCVCNDSHVMFHIFLFNKTSSTKQKTAWPNRSPSRRTSLQTGSLSWRLSCSAPCRLQKASNACSERARRGTTTRCRSCASGWSTPQTPRRGEAVRDWGSRFTCVKSVFPHSFAWGSRPSIISLLTHFPPFLFFV